MAPQPANGGIATCPPEQTRHFQQAANLAGEGIVTPLAIPSKARAKNLGRETSGSVAGLSATVSRGRTASEDGDLGRALLHDALPSKVSHRPAGQVPRTGDGAAAAARRRVLGAGHPRDRVHLAGGRSPLVRAPQGGASPLAALGAPSSGRRGRSLMPGKKANVLTIKPGQISKWLDRIWPFLAVARRLPFAALLC